MPEETNDVIINAASFTTTGQLITGANGYFLKSLACAGALHSPAFSGPVFLLVYGDINLTDISIPSDCTISIGTSIHPSTCSLTSAGNTIGTLVNGTVTLLDDLTAGSIQVDDLITGGFDVASHDISFGSGGSATLGSSAITIEGDTAANFTIGSGATVDFGTSTINIVDGDLLYGSGFVVVYSVPVALHPAPARTAWLCRGQRQSGFSGNCRYSCLKGF